MVKPVYAFKYNGDVCIAMTDSESGNTNESIVYRFKGSLGVDLNLEVRDRLDLRCKNVRSRDEFLYFLKILYPTMHFNPIYLCNGNIVFDNPFVEVGGTNFCMWHPRFEIKVSMKYIEQDDSCVVYHYKSPIFIFTYDYKRHSPAVNEEYFSLNYKTGVAIHYWKQASAHEYTEYNEHFDGMVWVRDYFNQTPITGFKKRE